MKISGKAKLKITADGLRVIDLRLPFVIAHMAVSWLYFINKKLWRKAIVKTA
jgi:hypothetical protein